jgi:translation elongation factor EF-4
MPKRHQAMAVAAAQPISAGRSELGSTVLAESHRREIERNPEPRHKQKAGKKRRRLPDGAQPRSGIGKDEIPQEAFIQALKMEG